MTGIDGRRILFCGLGTSAVAWYRCVLPAQALGADWCGLGWQPPDLQFYTGLVKGATRLPRWEDYDLIVFQQPRGHGWLKLIKDLQGKGIKVAFEIDDYVDAIGSMKDHDFRDAFRGAELAKLHMNMRQADAILCSTEYIAHRYRLLNKRIFVCRNGLDLSRYKLTRPPRPTVNFLWAGGTGHIEAAVPWFQSLVHVMQERPDTCLVTIGQNFAAGVGKHLDRGAERCLAIPFTPIEQYPSAMTMGDIALAPAGHGGFHRGKSDLRFLEAGALGMAVIADPVTYGTIEHGETGVLAASPVEAQYWMAKLADDEELRVRLGENAREYVYEERSMKAVSADWTRAFGEILG